MNNTTDNSDFLARERALLGADADQFSTAQDNVARATVEDGDDDLLGGGGAQSGGADMGDFESSFPAIDTGNDVSVAVLLIGGGDKLTPFSSWRPVAQSLVAPFCLVHRIKSPRLSHSVRQPSHRHPLLHSLAKSPT